MIKKSLLVLFPIVLIGCPWLGIDQLNSVDEPFRTILRKNYHLVETGGAIYSEEVSGKRILIGVGVVDVGINGVSNSVEVLNVARSFALKEIVMYVKGTTVNAVSTNSEEGQVNVVNGVEEGKQVTKWKDLIELRASGHQISPPTVGSFRTKNGTVQVVVLGKIFENYDEKLD